MREGGPRSDRGAVLVLTSLALFALCNRWPGRACLIRMGAAVCGSHAEMGRMGLHRTHSLLACIDRRPRCSDKDERHQLHHPAVLLITPFLIGLGRFVG